MDALISSINANNFKSSLVQVMDRRGRWFYSQQITVWEYKTGIILCMYPTNGRQCYNVTSFLIDWVHTQNDPCKQEQNKYYKYVICQWSPEKTSHRAGLVPSDSKPDLCHHMAPLGCNDLRKHFFDNFTPFDTFVCFMCCNVFKYFEVFNWCFSSFEIGFSSSLFL